jgi:4-hydroxy-4-methyl-2-oxoglutarate aldolase
MPNKKSPLEMARAATANARAAAGMLHEVTEDLTPRLAMLYTGVVHDVMRGMGLKDFTLPHTFRPLTVAKTIAGPVFTVRGKVNAKADPHETLLAWTGFLSKAKSGHIVVIAANDEEVAHMGELSGETLMRKGVPGVIVDGGTRDVEFLMEMGFPIYARYATPRDIVGYWMVDAMDVPIKIGKVAIAPHDYLLADRDGIIVVPRDKAAAIVSAAAIVVGTESQIRTAILGGMDPQEAYLKFGKF